MIQDAIQNAPPNVGVNLVLKVLFDQGKITQEQYEKASTAALDVVKKGTLLKEAYPAYLDLVKRQLTPSLP